MVWEIERKKTSVLTCLLFVFGAMALIECCIRGPMLRLKETTLTKQTPISCQLLLSTAEIESQIILSEFEEKNRK
jgi:hypothetical protein